VRDGRGGSINDLILSSRPSILSSVRHLAAMNISRDRPVFLDTGSGPVYIRTASHAPVRFSDRRPGAVYSTVRHLQIRSKAYPGANFALRRHGPRSAKANSINTIRIGWPVTPTGRGHCFNSPSVGSSDTQGRQGTDAWCARGRAHARRCGNCIWPKVTLEWVDGIFMSMSGLSGSTTSPLTIDGTKICESG
jgi:hypothetical protein